MHILITANAAWNIWNFRRPLLIDLLSAGYRVTVFAPFDESVSGLEELGCKFRHLDMNAKGLNPIEGIALLRRFKRVFQDECPDIVFSYTIKNNIFGAIAARTCRVPFVPNVTGLGTAFLSGNFLQQVAERLYRKAFKHLPIVFFQNEDDASLFLERELIQYKQARILPGSGIDLSRFSVAPYPKQEVTIVFLMIARLLKDKGVLEYVAAAKKIRDEFPEVRFQLLGATDSENRTSISRDTVSHWERENIIEYLETTSDVRPYIAEAHCVVLPSYREGAPRTLIEAASLGRPLITTDVAGCRSVIENGKSGLICRVKDSESLAKSCRDFLDLTISQKEAMGQAGRAKMEAEFDVEIVIEEYKKSILELS